MRSGTVRVNCPASCELSRSFVRYESCGEAASLIDLHLRYDKKCCSILQIVEYYV